MDFEPSDDGRETVPLLPTFSRVSSFEKCSSSSAVRKRGSEFDDNNSLHISVKKSKLLPYDDHDKDGHDISLSKKLTDKSFSSLKKDLTLLEQLFAECKRKQKVEEKRLQSIKRDTEECFKELQIKKKQVSVVRRIDEAREKVQEKIDDCIKEFVVKEEELYLMENLIKESKLELKAKEIELNQVKGNISKEIELRQVIDNIDKDRERKEEELKALSQKIAEITVEFMAKEIELDAANNLIGELEEKLESEKKKLLQVISMKKRFEGRVEELESKEKHLEGRVKELESRKKQLEGHMEEFDPKEKKELVNELESEKKHIESGLQELEFKEKQFEGQKKEFHSKEEEFKGRVKEFKSEKKQFESQVEHFKSKEKQFERRWKELELKENKFIIQVKEFELKEKQFGRQVNGLESKLNKLDGQLKKPGSTKKQNDALTEHIAKEKDLVAYMDDQLSRTFGGKSFQLYTSDKTDGVEYDGILVDLLESSDPSRLVLDMIQNPIVPLCKKGDNVVIIADYQILLLEQLMKISPNIEPCVRDEALKLALDMKANMKENSKNSLGVLGFLLLLSNYGLVTYFDEDELLELFAFVAQHKIAVELFGTLGFANKVSDFVENLIRRKQFVVAVTFSCAYNLADKNKLVDLLQEQVRNAKLICESSCKKTNSIEIKDKARDQEIASLRTVLQCILDHNLQSEDLLDKEIQYRILELKAHKGH